MRRLTAAIVVVLALELLVAMSFGFGPSVDPGSSGIEGPDESGPEPFGITLGSVVEGG